MIVYDVEQGTLAWQMLRMGIPTASSFDKILTPGGKPSKQADDYMRHLIAEMIVGGPLDAPKTSWMERGHDMEGEAVCWYEFARDVAAPKVGFITNDAGTIGVSPDRLIEPDGLLEIKCPSPAVHVGYLLYSHVDQAYWPQLQGQLYITGREWLDICSYHPLMPSVVVRVERDANYIALLASALDDFVTKLEAEKQRVRELGFDLKEHRRHEAMEATRRAA